MINRSPVIVVRGRRSAGSVRSANPSWYRCVAAFRAVLPMVLVSGYFKPPMRGERTHQRGETLCITDGHNEQAIRDESIARCVAELILAVGPVNCESHVLKPAMQWATRGWVRVYPLSAMRIGGSA